LSTRLASTSAAASPPSVRATASTGLRIFKASATLMPPDLPACSPAEIAPRLTLVRPNVAISATPKRKFKFAYGSLPKYVLSLAVLYKVQRELRLKIPSFLRSSM